MVSWEYLAFKNNELQYNIHSFHFPILVFLEDGPLKERSY